MKFPRLQTVVSPRFFFLDGQRVELIELTRGRTLHASRGFETK